MLSELIRQLIAACGILFRTIRAIFVRGLQSGAARVRNAANLSRQAAKAAPALMKKVTDVSKKPTKREDYIETQQMFISKSFLVTLLVVLVLLGLLAYLMVWPWVVSHFLTAKFWCEDPRTEDYTGRVILYYEKEKDTVLFKGRLEDGVIQGQGEAYDENGLLVYSGNYIDGVYSGQGKLFDQGNLIYEGEFLEGLYDGEGVLYAEDTGALLYEGGFEAGIRSGEGTEYQDGLRLYKGEFVEDLYNGDGILYKPDGGIRYRGTFLDGLYSGSGVLNLDSGATVQAEFEQGDVIGDARCFMNGKLYYEGSLRQFVPDGMGTLYGGNGKALYTGPMKHGVIDGSALLEMPAADLRGMLEDTAEKSYDQGFAITCEALGFAAFCSYAQEDADPMVYRVYVYAPKDSRPLAALLWENPEAFEDLSRQDEIRPERLNAITVSPWYPKWFPVDMGADAVCLPYRYEEYTLNLWSLRGAEAPSVLEWRLGQTLPEGVAMDSGNSASEGQLESLIARLGLVTDRLASGGSGGNSGGGSGGGGGGPSKKNSKNGEALLKAVGEDKNVYPVLKAALNYLELKELRSATQDNLDLYKAMAEDEEARISAGTGNEDNLADLKDARAQAEVQVTKYTAQMRREARTIEEATELQAYEYDLSDLLIFFETDSLDIEALGEAVIAAAEDAARKQAEAEAALNKEKEEEEEPEEAASDEAGEGEDAQTEENGEEAAPEEEEKEELVIPEIDRRALMDALEDNLLDLELACRDVQLALRSYENALISVEDVKDRHSVGEADKAAVQRAQITANTRRGILYSAMAAFTRQAAVLDESTGGFLAAEQHWLTAVLVKKDKE